MKTEIASWSEPGPPSASIPKVVIVAPNASSRFGGEAFLPLKYFQILRLRGHPAKLVTHARNRADLATMLAPYLDDVSFVEDTTLHRALWRLGTRFPKPVEEAVFGTMLALLDGFHQARLIRKLVRDGQADVIHQPTPVSPLAPSGMHRFGVPLILGPMNGGMNYPPGYDDLESPRTRRFVAWSRRLAWLLNRAIPGKRRATVLLVANQRTRDALPFPDHPDIRFLVENGVDLSIWRPGPEGLPHGAAPWGADRTLRLVFMGRFIALKTIDVTLEALARALAEEPGITLELLGDGPERPRLERLVAEMGLERAVRFHGFQPQDVCAKILGGADALILNSVRECGGAVVLEAMAQGLPVIAADWGGPADYLDDECGILVSPVPKAGFAARLAGAMLRLARDPGLRYRMGAAGRRKAVEQYDWDKKVDRMIAIYAEVAQASLGRLEPVETGAFQDDPAMSRGAGA